MPDCKNRVKERKCSYTFSLKNGQFSKHFVFSIHLQPRCSLQCKHLLKGLTHPGWGFAGKGPHVSSSGQRPFGKTAGRAGVRDSAPGTERKLVNTSELAHLNQMLEEKVSIPKLRYQYGCRGGPKHKDKISLNKLVKLCSNLSIMWPLI